MSRLSRLSVVLSAVIVIIVGFSTLLGLLFGDVAYAIPEQVPVIGGVAGVLNTDILASVFVRIAAVTIALTVLTGVFNLLFVNATRLLRGRTIGARLSSMLILATFVATIMIYVLDRERSQILITDVITPIESALASLLFFALVYGAFRLLRDKITWAGLLFVITVEVVLIGSLAQTGLGIVAQFTDWLIAVPVNAGVRGILLGIALATIVTGMRVLIGQDRTYGE